MAGRPLSKHPAMGLAGYHWGAWRMLAAEKVNWRLWNKPGPRQRV